MTSLAETACPMSYVSCQFTCDAYSGNSSGSAMQLPGMSKSLGMRYSLSFVITANNTRQWDWKLVCIFQLLVPVLILCLITTIPGTPRW